MQLTGMHGSPEYTDTLTTVLLALPLTCLSGNVFHSNREVWYDYWSAVLSLSPHQWDNYCALDTHRHIRSSVCSAGFCDNWIRREVCVATRLSLCSTAEGFSQYYVATSTHTHTHTHTHAQWWA